MRQLSEFDEQNYLYSNLDVLSAVRNGLIRSGWDHFYRIGYRENRLGISDEVLQKVQAFWSELESIPLEARKHRAIDTRAHHYGVVSSIHPDDMIFNYVIQRPTITPEDAIEYYFSDGEKSSQQFLSLVSQYLGTGTQPLTVLEFASGYGMVKRHLAKEQSLNVCSCDIHSQAVHFLDQEIGVRSIQSSSCPEILQLPMQFDVVFALSFFSHMPITTWVRWLVRLIEAARVGGMISFSTHGLASLEACGNPEVSDLGFWFVAHSEQSDLIGDEYGTTLVTPTFVRKCVASIPSAELLELREGYWWGHQDLYVLRRL